MAKEYIRFLQHGNQVLMVVNDQVLTEIPWQAALECAKALHQVAKKAEELDNAEKIANDQAILMRSGMPLALSLQPQILEEAKKEAAWNSQLRKAIPKQLSIPSGEKFGRPAIKSGRNK